MRKYSIYLLALMVSVVIAGCGMELEKSKMDKGASEVSVQEESARGETTQAELRETTQAELEPSTQEEPGEMMQAELGASTQAESETSEQTGSGSSTQEAYLVTAEALDMGTPVIRTTADTLLEHASPETSAMTLFIYDGKVVRSATVYSCEKEQEILDDLNSVKAVKADDWTVEDASLPIYGLEIGREDGWSILAAWSDGYWIAQDGAAYRFDFDFERLANEGQWEDERELPSFTSFPCARLFTQEGDGWNPKYLVPADPLNPPAGITMTLDAFEGSDAVVNISNESGEDWDFGEFYEVQALVDGTWYEIPTMPGNWGFNCMGYFLEAGSSQSMIHHLGMYGELPPGVYRIVLEGLSTEFTVP